MQLFLCRNLLTEVFLHETDHLSALSHLSSNPNPNGIHSEPQLAGNPCMHFEEFLSEECNQLAVEPCEVGKLAGLRVAGNKDQIIRKISYNL